MFLYLWQKFLTLAAFRDEHITVDEVDRTLPQISPIADELAFNARQ